MFYGSGAGKLPTASAVVADIIEAVQNMDHNVPLGWTDEKQEILPMDQTKFRYFIRFAGKGAHPRAKPERTRCSKSRHMKGSCFNL